MRGERMKQKINGMFVLFLSTVVPTIGFFSQPIEAATATIQVVSATIRDKTIPNAEIIFQKNGMNSISTQTDASGRASMPSPFIGVDDQSVNMIAKAPGYSTLVVKCPCSGLTYALSESMSQLDGIRIVLSWGERPNDLDAHLVYSGNHVWYKNMNGLMAKLDIDNRQGTLGPETITIDRKIPGQRYLYAVHTFADQPDGFKGPYTTKARVAVYIGSSLIKTYYFTPGQEDTMLYLFEIDELGVIHDILKTTSVRGLDKVEAAMMTALNDHNYEFTSIKITEDLKLQARNYNQAGESAYHNKDMQQAIHEYVKAIELDPEYGQAYSNLGLAYQKTGQISEAIWANRKAIQLANGPDKEVVRASSYYNIGRIYESQSRWDDALFNYKSANAERSLNTYQQAMERVRKKSGH
jgi:tetratricopeptide (TPR) repeat protein